MATQGCVKQTQLHSQHFDNRSGLGVIQVPHDNCDQCGQDYDFDKIRDTLVIYIQNPECNHVQAMCPHCGNITRIYLVPEGVIQVAELHLPLQLGLEAPEDMQSAAMELWGEVGAEDMWPFKKREASDDANRHWSNAFKREAEAALPEPPRDWLIQLHDMMRHFNDQCDGSCDES